MTQDKDAIDRITEEEGDGHITEDVNEALENWAEHNK